MFKVPIKKIYYSIPKNIRSFLLHFSKIIVNIEKFENQFINNTYEKIYFSKKEKKILVNKITKMMSNIHSATNLNLHLYVIDKLFSAAHNFNLNKSFIVEAGVYKGAMTCSLSLAAKMLGTKLIVYDSFEGLPDIKKKENIVKYHHMKKTSLYKKGMYKGNYDEVIENIKKFGSYESCIFRKGFFKNSMKNSTEKIFFLFLDVDLLSSTIDVIKNLWKNVLDNSYVFTDDASDLDLNRIWFDKQWWKKNLNQKSPGFIGAGCGLPIGGEFSSLGYTIKNPKTLDYNNFNY